ncbi:MAG TPA: hypothetical protein VJT50_07695 [Pyrinomonadaceae bacterium]|nr:hypothetical protein [Pyrinomonadaceae bacterium]
MGAPSKKFFSLAVAAVALLLIFSAPGAAQCSMCRAALAGSNNALFIRNFNVGVLVLLLPPVSIFCSIFVVLKRSRRKDEQAEADSLESKSETDA